MADYRESGAALDAPLRQWWAQSGAWLLLALAGLGLVPALLFQLHHYDPWQMPPLAMIATGLAGAAVFFGIPLVWLLAAQRVLDLSPAAAPQALYVQLLRQGILPLAVVLGVRTAAELLTVHSRAGQLEVSAALQSGVHALGDYIPLMFVVLGLLALSRNGALATGLTVLGVMVLQALRVLYGQEEAEIYTWHGWYYAAQIAAGAAMLWLLVFAHQTGRRKLWRAACAVLCASLALTPVVFALSDRFDFAPLAYLAWVIDTPSITLFNNRHIGEWLISHYYYGVPLAATHSTLQLSWLLWILGFSAAVLGLMYWLLGRKWAVKNSSAGDASAPDQLGQSLSNG